MRTVLRLAALALVVRVAYGAWPGPTLIALAAGLPAYAILYVLSLYRRPWLPCPRCRGSNRNRDRRGPWRAFHSHCRRCGGAGEFPRLGARLLGTGRRD